MDLPAGKKYTAPAIDVYFVPRLCIHAARCVNGLPNVFVPDQRPWIRPGNATADELAATIDRCPTGALHYVRKDDGTAEVPDEHVSMTIVKDGPMYVRGAIELILQDGTPLRSDSRIALCRCGASQNKPYCDNSHKTADFHDPV